MQREINKPWGKEEILEVNDKYMLKRLTMHKNCRCSLQFHRNKCETVYVLSGELKIYTGQSKESITSKIYTQGNLLTIPPLVIHRMEAITDCIYLETSTPELEDTIRLEDDYGR